MSSHLFKSCSLTRSGRTDLVGGYWPQVRACQSDSSRDDGEVHSRRNSRGNRWDAGYIGQHDCERRRGQAQRCGREDHWSSAEEIQDVCRGESRQVHVRRVGEFGRVAGFARPCTGSWVDLHHQLEHDGDPSEGRVRFSGRGCDRRER
jgi:hypothetical protein